MTYRPATRDIQSIVDQPSDRTVDVLIQSRDIEAVKDRLETASIGRIEGELGFDILQVELPERAVATVRSWSETETMQVNHEFHFHSQGN
jgi:hypothetical protein